LDEHYEPANSFVKRSIAYEQRRNGWVGHLEDRLGEIFQPSYFEWHTYYSGRIVLSTIFRLLQTELAIQSYHAKHDIWPQTLSQLVPEYLQAVPIDPCSLEEQSLQYRQHGDGYLLYSVGYNRVDDHGEKSWQSLSYAVHGDLTLEGEFGEEEE
jgi:hypothetical protein